MAQFTLNWDNTPILTSGNVLNQTASYREKSLGGSYITTGFTPSNTLSKTVTSVDSPILEDNKIYQFKIESNCTVNGPTINQNGVQEGIVFSCLIPTVTKTSTSSQIVLNVANTDITKARFTLRKTSDSSIVLADTVVNRVGTTITCSKSSGLLASTIYYWQYDLYATINGVEVISSTNSYIGSKCSPYSFLTEESEVLCSTIDSVVATNLVASTGSNGQATITINATPTNGTFKYQIGTGSLIDVTSNPFTITGLSVGGKLVTVYSYGSGVNECSSGNVEFSIADGTNCEPSCPVIDAITTPAPGVVAVDGGGTAKVIWIKDDCADQYKVLVTLASNGALFTSSVGTPNQFTFDGGSKYSYIVNGLNPDVNYNVKVTAFKNGVETTECENTVLTPLVPNDVEWIYIIATDDESSPVTSGNIPTEGQFLGYTSGGTLTSGKRKAIASNSDYLITEVLDMTTAKRLHIAERTTQTVKTKWDWDSHTGVNNGNIGGTSGTTGNLFAAPIVIGTLRVYTFEYRTFNTAHPLELIKV
jgi:hypothetical protein